VSRRRGGASIAGSPVLIGALTTLVVIVAVFLSYNANNGLPFVPTYDVSIELPDAANLVEGNEVRLGGFRVGAVDNITPIRRPDGTAFVRIHMKLQKNVEKLPRDTTVLVRSRSALGLKYVQITPGKQPKNQGYEPGSTIPLAQARPAPVEFDDVINTFDRKTRIGQQNSLRGFGDALAGRGIDINSTIAVLPELLGNLNSVATNLNDPRTQVARLFPALERVASTLAPVAGTQAELFDNLNTTFTALASVARPFIQETISRGPAALDAGLRGFPEQRKLLENTTLFASDLAPGARALPDVTPDLADALEAGIPALRRTPSLNRRVQSLFVTLEDFSTDPLVKFGIERLNDTVATLNPTLAFFTPAQTTCNYVTLWLRNIASLLSEGDKNGTWQRFIIITTPQGPNSESGPSSAPANGPTVDNYLHANNYPNTAAPGQTHECEAGNETFFQGRQSIGNIPGNQGTKTFATGTDKAGSGN
jgi:virulence factor Mce-like protein